MSIDDAKTASRMKLRNRMVIHQRDILQFIPKKSWFETCTSGFKIWHVVLLIYLKFRGLWNLPMQRLAKIWETVPSFSLAKGEFFLRGWKLSTQRKGSMYEARCRLKFVAKCRLVSSFFFISMGHVVMGYLTTFKHVETGMYFRIWFADIDFEKKIYSDFRWFNPYSFGSNLVFLQIQPFFLLVSVVDVQSPHSLGKVVGKIRFDGWPKGEDDVRKSLIEKKRRAEMVHQKLPIFQT